MDKPIMVSVAIPTYNQEKYIAETVASVLAQKTDFNYEIVVGEDCSQDATRAILEGIHQQCPDKVRIICNEKNLGLLLNVKSILDSCRGKYIAVLGGDDLFCDACKLQKQFDFLEKNLDYGLVYSDAKLLIDHGGAKKTIKSWKKNFRVKVKEGFVFNDLLIDNFIVASTVFLRKKLYSQFVDFNKYLGMGFLMEDRPMYLDMALHSKFAYLDEPLSMYRITAGSVSRPVDREKLFSFYESSYLGRRHFIDEHCTDAKTKKCYWDSYHFFNLSYAFEFRMDQRFDQSLAYFKKNKTMNVKAWLYSLSYKVELFRRILNLFRKSRKRL